MELKNIIFEKKDSLAWITLNRPEVLNAQNDALRAELSWVLENCRDDDGIRVIVLSGAGEKAFSAGADISEFTRRTMVDALKLKLIKKAVDLIREMPKPVIAAVHGFVLGAGCELAMSCDIIIAAENTVFGQPEINVGVIPGAGGTQVLPRLIGEKRAKELVFTGGRLSVQEALYLGLVNRVVPVDKLKETATEMAKTMLRHSPVIMKLAKMAINKSLESTLSAGMEYERDIYAMCFSTEDQKEASTAFLEKRKPVYKGK